MPPKINNFRANNQNCLRFYEPMLILLLCCGYNFNFYDKNLITKVAAKVYCVILIIVIAYATLTCCAVHELSQIWSMIEYTSSVLIISCFKSQIRLFMQRLSDIDTTLRINRRHYHFEKYKIFIIVNVIWFIRIIYTYIYCFSYTCYDVLTMYLISQFALMSLDINRIWRCILYDVIRYRLKMLRIRIEEDPENDYYLYIKNNKMFKENKIKFCLHLYRSIADLMEYVSPELSASLFLSVACSLPKLVSNVYHLLLVIENHEPYESLGFVIMQTIQITFLLFSPFIIVERYAVEVERIRLYLMHKLIDTADTSTKADIQLFLNYIEMRSFRYRIWRIVPVNLSLPLELVNLCTNYVIVLINFTHLYG